MSRSLHLDCPGDGTARGVQKCRRRLCVCVYCPLSLEGYRLDLQLSVGYAYGHKLEL